MEENKEVQTQETAQKTQKSSVADDAAKQDAVQVKALTQDDIDNAVSNALKQWKQEQESERSQAEELSKLSKDDRQKRLDEIERKKFLDEKKAFEHEKLVLETTKQLAQKNLPVEFAGTLTGNDAKETLQNITAFEQAFSKAVQSATEDKLKGTVPKTGNNSQALITQEQFNKMTYTERSTLYDTNKEEYDRLVGGKQ